jgi:manganese efflux pump family protein
MKTVEIILLAISLAMDAFAVAISVGGTEFMASKRARFRISFHFGLFQFLMPVIGWFGGNTIQSYIENYDHWIALLLLAFVGCKMIRESRSTEPQSYRLDPSRGWSLMMLSIATSIDALAVGFSLAIMNVDIWRPSVLIGFITAGLSLLGILMGNRIGRKFGKRIEMLGGLTLIMIGIKIVIEHLFG